MGKAELGVWTLAARRAVAEEMSKRGSIDIDRVLPVERQLGKRLLGVDREDGNRLVDKPDEYLALAESPRDLAKAAALGGTGPILEPALSELFAGTADKAFYVPKTGFVSSLDEAPGAVLCGSFNPVHEGHQKLRDAAAEFLGKPVAYELSVQNADKAPMDALSAILRARQFTDHPLALTNAPRFIDKANVLPNTAFIVGADTAERIVQKKYYGDTEEGLKAALAEIQDKGCSFLVAARVDGSGKLQTLKDVDVPKGFEDLFVELPESVFRVDMSSTEVRSAKATTTKGKIDAVNKLPEVGGCFVGNVGSAAADLMLSVPGSSSTLVYSNDIGRGQLAKQAYGGNPATLSKKGALRIVETELDSLRGLADRQSAQGVEGSSKLPPLDGRRLFAVGGDASFEPGRGRAWVALRYLDKPGGEEKQIVVHARLGSDCLEAQSEAAGKLAVNLLHAAYLQPDADAKTFQSRLLDNLGANVKISSIEVDGEEKVDLRASQSTASEDPALPDAPKPPSTIEVGRVDRIRASGYTGVCAEIGAGQPVASILRAGEGSSGVVTKRVSQYGIEASALTYDGDKPLSRSVSKERVENILNAESEALEGLKSPHFVFADSIVVRDQKGGGWLGLRVKDSADAPHTDVYVHVRFLCDASEQRSLTRAFGLNLIEAGITKAGCAPELIRRLLDGLDPEKVEIDAIEGDNLGIGNDSIAQSLIAEHATVAVVVRPDGSVAPFSEVGYKPTPIVIRPKLVDQVDARAEAEAVGFNPDAVLVRVALNEPGSIDELQKLQKAGFHVLLTADRSKKAFNALRSVSKTGEIGVATRKTDFAKLVDVKKA